MEKFQRERTNFAEFEETVTELPTIVTYPVPQNSGMKNGVDFNISFQVASDFDSVSQTHLTQSGVYPVFGSSLEIRGIYTPKESIIFPQPYFQKEVILP